jgi:hypothetical protein
MDEIPQSFHWSTEIEEATLSILWHQPQRLKYFLQECDPAVHFHEPHSKIIFDAIGQVHQEVGPVSFEDMVLCLREYRQLDNVGGKDSLNRIYALYQPTGLPDAFYKTDSARIDKILSHHVSLLKTYAVAREFEPPREVHQYLGGKGCAYKNKAKRKGWQADYIGPAYVRGVKYQMSLNVDPQAEFINVKLEPPTR